MNKTDLVPLLQKMFIPNARYCQWAADKAQATIASQTELLPLYLQETEEKLTKSRQKLAYCQNDEKKAAIEARIKKLEQRRDHYLGHTEAGTIPRAVFGGKKNLRALQTGKISKAKWRELRSNAFYSRGQANQTGPNDQAGNANTELRHKTGHIFDLAVRIPTGKGRGQDEWVPLLVKVPAYYSADLRGWLASGQAYSVEIRRNEGRSFCHITLDLPEWINDQSNGIAGIDLNPGGIAVTLAYANGNFLASRWFPLPNLINASTAKRAWIIGNVACQISDYLREHNIAVAVTEKLKFKNNHDTHKRFNRITTMFAHKQMLEAMHVRGCKDGLEIRQVNPAFTSVIGQVNLTMLDYHKTV